VVPVEDAGPITGCRFPFIGDPEAELEVELIALGPDGKIEPITEGGAVTLMFPPQGGRVLFAGVRARNVTPCGVRLSGALKDPVSEQVRIDSRIINLEVTEEGWGRSAPTDISTFANIATCPNQWSSQDVFGKPHELILTLTEKDSGRKVMKSVNIVPTCNEPGQEEQCLCMCKQGYTLGEMCSGSGGAGGAGGAP
jgi:hypothetical protein